MAILFDRDFGRVWTDGATPYVFCSVIRIPEKEHLHELAEKQLTLIRDVRRKFGLSYSILDLHLCPQVPAELADEYFKDIISRQFKAGLKLKAIVKPEDKELQKQLEWAVHQLPQLPISLHNTFEEALTYINQMHHQKTNDKPRKSILSFLVGG